MRSINNSFDSSQDLMVVDGVGYSFTGTYESNLDKRYILINIYTTYADTLYVYHAETPDTSVDATPIITETYSISANQNQRLIIPIKCRFIKIKIYTLDGNERRVYDLFMLNSISDFQNTDTSGNVIVRNYMSDTSGNGIHSTNNKLNVYDSSGKYKIFI